MVIRNNVSSRDYNTFGIDVSIAQLIEINERKDLSFLGDRLVPDIKVLGGGSNILLTEGISSPVVYINTKGIELIKEGEEYILAKFEAGENWHEAVMWAVKNGYGGIENLSLIPGKCGAAPMQNIGAYGVEIKDFLHAVTAFDLEHGVELTFHNEECGFGYRTSNFKTIWKGRYVITDIILKLSKSGHHKINLSYGAIRAQLDNRGIEYPTIEQVSQVVMAIRRSKLPDPAQIGNAGSFFKNPIIAMAKYQSLMLTYPDMPSYPVDDTSVKVPAGWLIDQCGWKGKVVGQTGTYKNQALVLVNHGSATGTEIYVLSTTILESVREKYGIMLEREVNVWS